MVNTAILHRYPSTEQDAVEVLSREEDEKKCDCQSN
jgi:hypothetical protein